MTGGWRPRYPISATIIGYFPARTLKTLDTDTRPCRPMFGGGVEVGMRCRRRATPICLAPILGGSLKPRYKAQSVPPGLDYGSHLRTRNSEASGLFQSSGTCSLVPRQVCRRLTQPISMTTTSDIKPCRKTHFHPASFSRHLRDYVI